LGEVVARDNPEVIRLLLQYYPYSGKSLPFMTAQFEESVAPTQFEEFVTLAREFTSLWQAVLRRDMDLIKHLLVDGADANAIAPTGLSPIGWAAMKGDEDLVKILLDFHANVEAGFYTPLFLAAKHGKLKIVKILLDHGADIDFCNDRGRTPLSIAASAGNEAILSDGQSKAGIKAIDDLINGRDKRITRVGLLWEHLMTLPRKRHWPNHRLCHEPTTWRLTVFSKRGADPYRGDEPCSQLDLELSDNSRAYSEIVDLLLERGADVHSKDMLGLTPLWWAVNWGHLPVVKKLLQNKAFIEEGGDLRMTPLSWAIWNGHQNVVQVLLDNRAMVSALDFSIYPFGQKDPLFWAICSGSEHQSRQLLNHGPVVAYNAAIEMAVAEGHFELALLLKNRNPALATQSAASAHFQAIPASEERVIDAILGNGVDTDILYENNCTPLTLAAEKGCFAVVQQLLDQDVNPNIMDGEGRTALMVAASHGFANILKVLIENGANVHTMHNGWAALQRVAYDGHDSMVKLLLEHGADIEVNESHGTPLFLASLKGHSAVVELLLDHDANVHTRNGNGETALLVAAKYNYDGAEKVAVARLLLKHGADIDARSTDGSTPLTRASCEGYTDLVKLLLLENANIDTMDVQGRSALDWSVVKKHREIEQILREKRGDRVLEVPDNILEMSD
jgi:ankyrin repeat protein